MAPEVDLRELALERAQRSPPAHRGRRTYVTRYVIPGCVLLGFMGLLGWAARDSFLPQRKVSVVPVVVARAENRQAGTPLFQAAGWIEPRPTPINAAALTEGVVESLLVVEGQDVRKGEPVAKLVNADAKLALREAESELALREAEVQSAEAELKAAQLRIAHPVHLDAELADAESMLAKTETELAKLPFLTASAQGSLDYARRNLESKQSAGASISGLALQEAESDLITARAALEELQQREPRLQREAETLAQKQAALAKQRELLIDESRQLADAQAKLRAAQARRDQAQVAVERAELHLDRTVIPSPINGRILRLIAAPGTRVMGIDPTAEHSSSTVVTLYDPSLLQVRADVRLEDVPLVMPGQPVEIETASAAQPLSGVVLMTTASANIQKNTLEVKVAIQDPPPTIRPEMLVTATFLAPPASDSDSEMSAGPERLLVSRQLVQTSNGQHWLWIVDAAGIARRQTVELGSAGTEHLVEVLRGLRATDKLITDGREGLEDGDRVTISSDDQSIGLAAGR